jgi:hypothetical protein
MASEHSPGFKEAVGGKAELPRPDVDVIDLSSRGDISERFGDDTGDQDKESGVIDPRESAQSYDFGPSIVTIGRIQ